MKKPLLIVIAVVVVAVAIAGGARLYLKNKVTDAADALIARVAPIAEVTYGDAIATLRGKIELKDIEIRPRKYNTAVTIDSIALTGDSLRDLHQLGLALKGHRSSLPNHLSVAVTGLTFDPSSRLASSKAVSDVLGDPGLWSTLDIPYDLLYCAHRTRLNNKDYDAMGLHKVRMTMRLSYNFKPDAHRLVVRTSGIEPGINKGSLSLDFKTDSSIFPVSTLARVAQGKVPLTGGNFEYTDLGWNARIRQFCAGEMDVSEEQYAAGHTNAVWKALSGLGVHPSAKLEQAYRDFVRQDNGTLALSLDMRGALKWEYVKSYSLAKVLYFMNPTLSLGGDTFTTENIGFDKAPSPHELARKTGESRDGTEDQNRREDQKYTFKKTSPDRVSQYVGRMIILRTDLGSFKGILKRVGERAAYIKVRYWDGYREELVPFDAVVAAQVGTPIDKKTTMLQKK